MPTEGRGIKLTQLEEIVAFFTGVCSLLVRKGQAPCLHQSRGHLDLIVLAQGHTALCWCGNCGACTIERKTRIWMVPRASPRMWQQTFMDRS